MHPPPHNTAAPAAHPEGPLGDLTKAMAEAGVSAEQVLAFAAKKGVLKEDADPDMPILSDIVASKIPVLTKMINTKGQALKEMKGEA